MYQILVKLHYARKNKNISTSWLAPKSKRCTTDKYRNNVSAKIELVWVRRQQQRIDNLSFTKAIFSF